MKEGFKFWVVGLKVISLQSKSACKYDPSFLVRRVFFPTTRPQAYSTLGGSAILALLQNQVKSNARVRFHLEYHGKTSSEIVAGFPLFVKTIAGSSLFL
jgi:hypothetical protein